MIRTLIDRLGWGIAGVATLTLVLLLAGVVSAGPLDPAAPPSSSSGVFGAGTPISSLPYTISTPGSYYLTGNLTGVSGQDGITIASHDVSLDLRGFTLQGVPGFGSGVRVQPAGDWRAINVRNGTARGWGTAGFDLQSINGGGVFDSLTAEGNAAFGFIVGRGTILSRCAASGNVGTGINALEATIDGCAARLNGGHGFQIVSSLLKNCSATVNTSSGIDALSSMIDGCFVFGNTQFGINATQSDVTGNKVQYNANSGIVAQGAGGLVARNTVHGNSIVGTGYGIDVTGSVHRIEDNHVTDDNATAQNVGIRVVGGENIVIRNSAHDNATNYDLSGAGGTYGPLATAAAATNPFTNIEY